MNTTSNAQHIALLQQHRMLPHGGEVLELAKGDQPHSNLVAPLLRVWRHALRPLGSDRRRRRYARSMIAWLEMLAATNAELSWGVPRELPYLIQEGVGPRLVLWPNGVPHGWWVGIVSSRLRRDLDHYPQWFAALRHTCETLDSDRTTIITAARTTTCPYLERCSEVFRLPLLRFEVANTRQSFPRWLAAQRNRLRHQPDTADRRWPALVSPALSDPSDQEQPVRDRLVAAVSDQLIVLRMRSKGRIEDLVRQRTRQAPAASTAHTRVLVGPDLVPDKLAATLSGVQRIPFHCPPYPTRRSPPLTTVGTPGKVLSLQQMPPSKFLTHWTRRSAGPWPNQSVADYHESLILNRHDVDHSALATLARIASWRRLIATNLAIRGGTPMVCFTAVPLNAIKSLRTFRVHRGRWDFERYGICIRQEWLEQHGTRKVRYGDASLWHELPVPERPYYQRQFSRTRRPIDWSVEQEWRHAGDVDLGDLPANAALLFVPTYDEAQWLSPQSIWPIVVLDQ